MALAKNSPADHVVILDFETTGLSPVQGDRAIEIGAVRLVGGEVTDRFQMLMNPGVRVSSFIESYTGITNGMLVDAASCGEVMKQFAAFIGEDNLVAHNASFDKRFLDAELTRIDAGYGGGFACSMLIARRLYPEAPNHKLGGLVKYKQIETDGVFHRALADSEMTARLWLLLVEEVQCRTNQVPTFALMQKISRTPKAAIARLLDRV